MNGEMMKLVAEYITSLFDASKGDILSFRRQMSHYFTSAEEGGIVDGYDGDLVDKIFSILDTSDSNNHSSNTTKNTETGSTDGTDDTDTGSNGNNNNDPLALPNDYERARRLLDHDIHTVTETDAHVYSGRVHSHPPNNTNPINTTSSSSSSSSSTSQRVEQPPRIVQNQPQPLEKGTIHRGTVTAVKEFGLFVRLSSSSSSSWTDGLVHTSQIPSHISTSALERGQIVFVRVLDVQYLHYSDTDRNGSSSSSSSSRGKKVKVSLSMLDVDQETGADTSSHHFHSNTTTNTHNSHTSPNNHNNSHNRNEENDEYGRHPTSNTKRRRRRMDSPEMWEMKQLIAAGVLDPSHLHHSHLNTFNNINNQSDDDLDDDLDDEGVEVEVEIELAEVDPVFLKGQTRRSRNLPTSENTNNNARGNNGGMSPVRIVKVPDGSMNRAAVAAGELAKERREIKRHLLRSSEDDPNNNSPSKPSSSSSSVTSDIINSNNGGEWRREMKAQSVGKRTTLSINEQRRSLPIYALRQALLDAVHENQVMVVIGDTGSGKTTQLTQYLDEEGYTRRGMVGCTQPRRVAAMSVARRVAEEMGSRVGGEVGYTIRFEDCTTRQTRLKYLTDGMLLREALLDRNLSQYSVIILDEAHERTIHTDVLFGLLKDLLKRRADLKVIITSATLDAEKFSKYFYDCPIFTIPGRAYPVEIMFANEPETDYLDAALITVMQIHLNDPQGDILVFLTGQEEIDTACEVLYSRMKALGKAAPDLIILPVYSALPSEIQSRIFEPAPSGARKCVLATNIAETSITIDGIYYVVDPGFVKQNCYDPKLGMDQLVIVPISQAQARQRSGRAGRTGPGKCYRLYTESAFHFEMLPNGLPEIQRTNLANTVLTLKAMGINDLVHFDFMDKPPHQSLITALELLYNLGALDDEGFLTRAGRKMAEFPLEPQVSKMLIASVDLGCSEEVLTIVAMLSIPTVFYRPKDKLEEADKRKSRFHQPEGDHLTLLTVYNAWRNHEYSQTWCFDTYVQYRALKRAQDVRNQINTIMDRYRIPLKSCGRKFDLVRKAITAGFFMNASRKDPSEGYKTVNENTTVFIHPSSALFNRGPQWVVYHELVMTSKEYMREVTAIDPKWLVEMAPTFYKSVDPRLSKRRKAQRIEPLYKKFAEKDDWRISKVR